jgi:hypothetical protein
MQKETSAEMPEVKFFLENDGDWEEVGSLDVEVVPREGDVVAFDEPRAGHDDPVGNFLVTYVRHNHFWRFPDKHNIFVFLRDPND